MKFRVPRGVSFWVQTSREQLQAKLKGAEGQRLKREDKPANWSQRIVGCYNGRI